LNVRTKCPALKGTILILPTLPTVFISLQLNSACRFHHSTKFFITTHKLEHVPVEDIIIGETLAMKEIAEQLPQVRVVWFVIKPQGTAEVEVYSFCHQNEIQCSVSLPEAYASSSNSLPGSRADSQRLNHNSQHPQCLAIFQYPRISCSYSCSR
uniref:Uncharacterized protein n=1 Tax=Salvator merianae TaxID=96440 RepID=A0A8D0DRL8_SALMN